MIDLKLNPDGGLRFPNSKFIRDEELVEQAAQMLMQLYKGEYLLDSEIGMPFNQGAKTKTKGPTADEFRAAILYTFEKSSLWTVVSVTTELQEVIMYANIELQIIRQSANPLAYSVKEIKVANAGYLFGVIRLRGV